MRRRANIGVAETAMTFMLMLAKRTWESVNKVTFANLERAGRPYRAFDRRHTSNANFARVPGLRALHGSTLGIIGLGEIGREIALRAAAFEMNVLYYQRTALSAEDEARYRVRYAPVSDLLAESDFVVPQLPLDATTRGIFDSTWFAAMKQ